MFLFSSPCRARKTHAYIPDVRKYHVSSVLFHTKPPFHIAEHNVDKVLTGFWEASGSVPVPS